MSEDDMNGKCETSETEQVDSCRYCGKGLWQEEVECGFDACYDCMEREGEHRERDE